MITTLQYNLFRLLYTCRTNAKELHTLKASADEMKVYIDQIVSKAEAQGLQHYTTDGNVQRFYSCFQTVGQNKDLDCSIFTDLFYPKYITAL